jgi:tripartite-type tricarboxylate transporter receptor subunit TctC
MRRREFLKTAAAAGATPALPLPALTQGAADFPNKPIARIMSWPAGTGIDMWHRSSTSSGR